MTILVDTDAFIAIESSNDALHKRAVTLLEHIQDYQVRYWTTWDVVDEVATKLSYFLSKQQSLDFLQFLDTEGVQISYPNKKRHAKAVSLFAEIVSKRVSLTDCINMVAAAELKIDYIFSFDKIYQQHKIMLLEQILQK